MTEFLATKFFIPNRRSGQVARPHLVERIEQGLTRKLILVSAPAGFGKTSLVAEWIADNQKKVAWCSLDPDDQYPMRFLGYLVRALQTAYPEVGASALEMVQAQSASVETILTTLINEISNLPDERILVLDDYHVAATGPIDQALTFLLEHLPPQFHIVLTTREDPDLPLNKLRVAGDLMEVRAADLRFTLAEAAEFLSQVMGLRLSEDDIAALEQRTEGWIAGLQLAAISMQGIDDKAEFIESFTGSHRFVLDYLVEEVLQQQPEHIQNFLLRTAILEKLSGSLCDAVLQDPEISSQTILETVEQANLFLIPLDAHRRWYRYHHLFADLLRQQLQERQDIQAAELHVRASEWYEANGFEVDAFRHAAAANDIERAKRLMEGGGAPLQFRGAMAPVLGWLESLPEATMNEQPSLWVTYASALTMAGMPVEKIEQILLKAEAALQVLPQTPENRDLIGQAASIRAMAATPRNQTDLIIAEANRALEYLSPDNLPVRATISWTLGYVYQFTGERESARQAYEEAVLFSQQSGNLIALAGAKTSLAQLLEGKNQLGLAEEAYREILQLCGNPPLPIACEPYIGLARIAYQRNQFEAAEQAAQDSLNLALQMPNVDTPISCDLMFARLLLAGGDAVGAAEKLAQAERFARQNKFDYRLPEIAALQIRTLLAQGSLNRAEQLAEQYDLPLGRARVLAAAGDTAGALAVAETVRQEVAAKGWQDRLLSVWVLLAVLYQKNGELEQAAAYFDKVLAVAEPEGILRVIVDEGALVAPLITDAAARQVSPQFTGQLRELLESELQDSGAKSGVWQPLVEPLTERELEVLQLVAEGLSNREISEKLYLALDTIKGYNRKIYQKLQVQRRTEAVARAKEIGLL